MLREQIKRICAECGLTQKALAAVLDRPHQRVRDMAAGRVEKLTREEGEALIRKLNIRADWLATGEGPMFQSEGEQALRQRLDVIGSARDVAVKLGLCDGEGRLLIELLYYVETGDGDGLKKVLARFTELAPAEWLLVDNFRRSQKKAKANLLQTSALLAAGLSPAGATPPSKIKKQVNVSAPGGEAAGRDIVNKGRKR